MYSALFQQQSGLIYLERLVLKGKHVFYVCVYTLSYIQKSSFKHIRASGMDVLFIPPTSRTISSNESCHGAETEWTPALMMFATKMACKQTVVCAVYAYETIMDERVGVRAGWECERESAAFILKSRPSVFAISKVIFMHRFFVLKSIHFQCQINIIIPRIYYNNIIIIIIHLSQLGTALDTLVAPWTRCALLWCLLNLLTKFY